jgi:hypothetical protein
MPISSNMTPDQFQDHMDKLSIRVSQALGGERLEDAMSACAACIGFGMIQLPPEQHDKMRAHLDRIIDVIIEKAPRTQ